MSYALEDAVKTLEREVLKNKDACLDPEATFQERANFQTRHEIVEKLTFAARKLTTVVEVIKTGQESAKVSLRHSEDTTFSLEARARYFQHYEGLHRATAAVIYAYSVDQILEEEKTQS